MYKRYYWLLLVATLLYLGFMFTVPPSPTTLAHYHISALELRLIDLTLVVPIVLIWFTAFYSFIHFEDYATRIKKSPDGHGLKAVADGLLLLGVGLVFGSLISAVLQFCVNNSVMSQATSTIINTHLALIFPFASFLFLLIGAQRLVITLKHVTIPMKDDLLFAVATFIIGLVFGVLTLHNPARTVAAGGLTAATYYLPDWLIITTIVVPSVITWALGLFAVLRLHTYGANVPGKAYRRVLQRLEWGLITVIVLSIGLQFLTTTTASLTSLGLGWLLLLLYVLLAAIAASFILIALAARKLRTLEELV